MTNSNSDSIKNDFLNIYQTLSRLQKKVFEYLQWFAKKFRCVFPCLQKIANSIGASIATVKRATALFEAMGWLFKKKRGYQSNVYYIHQDLIDLDLKDKSLFFREKCAENEPVLRNSSSDKENISTGGKVPIQKNEEKKDKEIPHSIRISGLTSKEQQQLANMFSEYALKEALEEAKWYTRQGNKIINMFYYFWGAAKRYTYYK